MNSAALTAYVAVVSPVGKWFDGPFTAAQAQAHLTNQLAAGNAASVVTLRGPGHPPAAH